MKNILSENLIRFGAKNLTESHMDKLQELEFINEAQIPSRSPAEIEQVFVKTPDPKNSQKQVNQLIGRITNYSTAVTYIVDKLLVKDPSRSVQPLSGTKNYLTPTSRTCNLDFTFTNWSLYGAKRIGYQENLAKYHSGDIIINSMECIKTYAPNVVKEGAKVEINKSAMQQKGVSFTFPVTTPRNVTLIPGGGARGNKEESYYTKETDGTFRIMYVTDSNYSAQKLATLKLNLTLITGKDQTIEDVKASLDRSRMSAEQKQKTIDNWMKKYPNGVRPASRKEASQTIDITYGNTAIGTGKDIMANQSIARPIDSRTQARSN